MRKLPPAIAVAVTTLAVGAATASASVVKVGAIGTLPNAAGWVNLDTRAPGFHAPATGPATPPLGAGSLRLVTPPGPTPGTVNVAKASVANADFAGAALSSVSAMSYWTYRAGGTGQALPSLQLQVDANGAATGGFTTLVYEPIKNFPLAQVNVNGVWKQWNALSGGAAKWWSTQAITGQCAGQAASCQRTFAQIQANNPAAVIVAVVVNQGSANPGIDANADALTFTAGAASTTWDFEPDADLDGVADSADNCPAVANADQADADQDGVGAACDSQEVPASASDCKKGGWQGFDGIYTFRNQGDCVSFVATNGGNPPAG